MPPYSLAKPAQEGEPEGISQLNDNLPSGGNRSYSTSENSRRLWLSEILCRKGFPEKIGALLENYSRFSGSTKCYPCQGFGPFPARKMAAGKSATSSGTLLDFLLRDRHNLLEFFWVKGDKITERKLLGPSTPRISLWKNFGSSLVKSVEGLLGFLEKSCGHCSWKSKDENRRNFSPKFRRVLRQCRRNISPEFRSRGLCS